MTIAQLCPAPVSPRALLADSPLRRAVSQMVRRRVPASDADDVTQTVLCDALAAPVMPTEPSELRRFVCVIARNKIADFHRRARRLEASEGAAEPACGPPPVEARALLRDIVERASASPRDRETLEWLVREHEGEELAEIASDVGLSAPAVRQRVSRLRRALRAEWAKALAVLLAFGASGLAARHLARDPSAVILADPAGDPGARVLGVAQGRWRLEADPGGPELSARRIDPALVELRVTGRRLEVSAPLPVAARTITRATTADGTTFELELTGDSGRTERATVVLAGDAMVVTLHDGGLAGTARLRRK